VTYKSKEVQDLAERITNLESSLRSDMDKVGRLAVLEEIKKCSGGLDNRIDKQFRTAGLFSAILLTLFGAFGYLGLQQTVPRIVQDSLGTSAKNELDRTRREAAAALADIQSLQKSAKGHSALIVLQTDYGSKGPYMGTLMGVIHRINPHAHLQTITTEINDFDAFDAAWTLWRASRFYPEGTIFVVITNAGGLTTRPVVILTKNGRLPLSAGTMTTERTFQIQAYSRQELIGTTLLGI
jgi:hypothetical protein